MLVYFVDFAGTGLLTGLLSILIMILIPFRRGELWAKWAIPLLLIVFNVFCLYFSATVAAETGASTQWPLSIVTIIVVLAAYIISSSIKKHY